MERWRQLKCCLSHRTSTLSVQVTIAIELRRCRCWPELVYWPSRIDPYYWSLKPSRRNWRPDELLFDLTDKNDSKWSNDLWRNEICSDEDRLYVWLCIYRCWLLLSRDSQLRTRPDEMKRQNERTSLKTNSSSQSYAEIENRTLIRRFVWTETDKTIVRRSTTRVRCSRHVEITRRRFEVADVVPVGWKWSRWTRFEIGDDGFRREVLWNIGLIFHWRLTFQLGRSATARWNG